MAYAPVIWIKFYLKPPEISNFVAVLNIVFSHISISSYCEIRFSANRNKLDLNRLENSARRNISNDIHTDLSDSRL